MTTLHVCFSINLIVRLSGPHKSGKNLVKLLHTQSLFPETFLVTGKYLLNIHVNPKTEIL